MFSSDQGKMNYFRKCTQRILLLTLELGLEPLHSLLLGHAVLHTDAGVAAATAGDAVAGALQDDEEVHTCQDSK